MARAANPADVELEAIYEASSELSPSIVGSDDLTIADEENE
jgi:hypothetical protein